MNYKTFSSVLRVLVALLLAVGTGAQAQAPLPRHLSGIINDYTPATGVSGPWELHGKWSLTINRESGKADFSGFMTMEHSDYWVLANPSTPPAPPVVDNPPARSPHTHHITMTGMVSLDTTVCPANNPPTTSAGFVVTGPVSITANGNPAPFETKGPSMLQICITGGADIPFSNVSLVLTGAAAGHFGMHAINGVVRTVRNSDKDDNDRR